MHTKTQPGSPQFLISQLEKPINSTSFDKRSTTNTKTAKKKRPFVHNHQVHIPNIGKSNNNVGSSDP